MNYQKSQKQYQQGLTKDLLSQFSNPNWEDFFYSKIFQNYLEIIPVINYIIYFHGTTQICSWKYNVMARESINNFAPVSVDHHSIPDMNFNGHCLIKNNISIPKKEKNLCISYTHISYIRILTQILHVFN